MNATSAPPGVEPVRVERPADAEAVRDALARASADGLRVRPVGAGTSGGWHAPDEEWVALRASALAGVRVYEPADLTLTAGAGTTLGELDEAAKLHGQWLPFDPPGAPGRTLGGLVATGARGPLATAYGAPRDHVLGATLVTGDGRTLRLGGRVMKNVAGFDLLRAVVGSRGALGVIVDATVRLFPRPEVDRCVSLEGPLDRILEAAARIRTAPLVPASASLLSPAPSGEQALLVVRLDGAAETVEADRDALETRVGAALSGPDAAVGWKERVRDAAWDAPLVVRASGLPSGLGARVDAVRRAVPGAEVVADILAGWVRAASAEVPRVGALAGLARDVGEAGGELTLLSLPAELAREGSALPSPPDDAGLARALKAHFDPEGVLAGGAGAWR